VSDTDLIASALPDLAAQAVTVPPAADAIWRAGQRRWRRDPQSHQYQIDIRLTPADARRVRHADP
jgi:hypothetical protein